MSQGVLQLLQRQRGGGGVDTAGHVKIPVTAALHLMPCNGKAGPKRGQAVQTENSDKHTVQKGTGVY